MINLFGMVMSLVSLTTLFLLTFPSFYYSLYLDYWWFDPSRHFLGGFFVAMFFAYYLKNHFLSEKKIQNILIIISATIFVGVLWEFSEYIASQTLTEPVFRYYGIRAYFMGDLPDTMNDLLIDILGAFIFAVLRLLWSQKSLDSFKGFNTEQIQSHLKD